MFIMAGADSDDDFVSNSPPIISQAVKRNLNIPVGHILAALKWRNTSVSSKLSETIKVLYSSGLGVVDFHPSGECAVIFLSAAELIEGQLYRKRLAGLRSVKGIRKVVIAERTQFCMQQFSALQQFSVIELQIDLIPITENNLSTVLVQMVYAENKIAKNPFQITLKADENEKELVIATLKNVPKLGEKKIYSLLEKFDSLYKIANASADELSAVLGASLGKSVWEYFNR